MKVNTIKYLTQDELRRLLAVIPMAECKDESSRFCRNEGDCPLPSPTRVWLIKRNLAIFLTAYRHGLRVSEVGLLRLDDFNAERGKLFCHREKNGISGEYPMQADEVSILKAWLKERNDNIPALFPSLKGRPISRRVLDELMKEYGEKADIPPQKRHFHTLRHSVATHLLDSGAGIRFVQDWLGHARIQTTMAYSHITNKARDEQAQRVFANDSIVHLDFEEDFEE